jgi:hypothetical protein
MFNLNEVKEGGNGNAGLYIYPGVKEVVVKGWTTGSSASGTPLVEVELVTLEAFNAKTENASKKFSFYLSDKAKDASMSKIKHIVTKVTKEANIKAVSTAQEFVDMLNFLTVNKSLRMKFIGEEYEYNGEIKSAARIGLPAFAEAINPGAEYEPVEASATKLTFDKTNQYDYKTLVASPTSEDSMMPSNNIPAWG